MATFTIEHSQHVLKMAIIYNIQSSIYSNMGSPLLEKAKDRVFSLGCVVTESEIFDVLHCVLGRMRPCCLGFQQQH